MINGIQDKDQVRTLLNEAYKRFAQPGFIPDDPILIPHRFSNKENIEIAGFLAATIAWGQRKTIINNAHSILERMDHAPADFIRGHVPKDRLKFKGFVHRTFNEVDAIYFMEALQYIYLEHRGLEGAFFSNNPKDARTAIEDFRSKFFEMEHLIRSEKHVSSPAKGSSAKRLNMYLRWMVRPDHEGVDFGIWKRFSPSLLMMPLDIHTATIGRKLGLLTRKQNDWKAVEELTGALRSMDPEDPVKYDFALFGLGVSGLL